LGIFKKDGTSTVMDVLQYTGTVLETFEVSYAHLTCVVKDTESAMVEAGCLFKQKSSDAGGTTAWHGCINQILELITKLASKNHPNSGGTMSACHFLVDFFNSSSQASLNLKEKSKQC
jgi:hypothetical protein